MGLTTVFLSIDYSGIYGFVWQSNFEQHFPETDSRPCTVVLRKMGQERKKKMFQQQM